MNIIKFALIHKLYEVKKENIFTGKNRIILIGPSAVGKTTISKELGKKLGLKILHLDKLNFGIMKDYSMKGRIKAVETSLNDKKYQDCILDFGGGHAYYKGVKEKLKGFKNIFALIPTQDIEFSEKLLMDSKHKRNKTDIMYPIECILKSLCDILMKPFQSESTHDEYENYSPEDNDKINRSLTDNIIEVFTKEGNRRSKSDIVNEIISKLLVCNGKMQKI